MIQQEAPVMEFIQRPDGGYVFHVRGEFAGVIWKVEGTGSGVEWKHAHSTTTFPTRQDAAMHLRSAFEDAKSVGLDLGEGEHPKETVSTTTSEEGVWLTSFSKWGAVRLWPTEEAALSYVEEHPAAKMRFARWGEDA